MWPHTTTCCTTIDNYLSRLSCCGRVWRVVSCRMPYVHSPPAVAIRPLNAPQQISAPQRPQLKAAKESTATGSAYRAALPGMQGASGQSPRRAPARSRYSRPLFVRAASSWLHGCRVHRRQHPHPRQRRGHLYCCARAGQEQELHRFFPACRPRLGFPMLLLLCEGH